MPTLSRRLADRDLRFDLAEEAFRLRRLPGLDRDGRTARTLVKDGPMRVTLIALTPGSTIPPHHAAGPVTIQPVWGRMTVRVEDEDRVLEVGDLLALGAEVEHAVTTPTGVVFALTVVRVGNPDEAR